MRRYRAQLCTAWGSGWHSDPQPPSVRRCCRKSVIPNPVRELGDNLLLLKNLKWSQSFTSARSVSSVCFSEGFGKLGQEAERERGALQAWGRRGTGILEPSIMRVEVGGKIYAKRLISSWSQKLLKDADAVGS